MVWIVAISVLFGGLRFIVPGHELSWPGTYEALVHIWVGALFTIALSEKFAVGCRQLAGASIFLMTAVEVFMFLRR